MPMPTAPCLACTSKWLACLTLSAGPCARSACRSCRPTTGSAWCVVCAVKWLTASCQRRSSWKQCSIVAAACPPASCRHAHMHSDQATAHTCTVTSRVFSALPYMPFMGRSRRNNAAAVAPLACRRPLPSAARGQPALIATRVIPLHPALSPSVPTVQWLWELPGADLLFTGEGNNKRQIKTAAAQALWTAWKQFEDGDLSVGDDVYGDGGIVHVRAHGASHAPASPSAAGGAGRLTGAATGGISPPSAVSGRGASAGTAHLGGTTSAIGMVASGASTGHRAIDEHSGGRSGDVRAGGAAAIAAPWPAATPGLPHAAVAVEPRPAATPAAASGAASGSSVDDAAVERALARVVALPSAQITRHAKCAGEGAGVGGVCASPPPTAPLAHVPTARRRPPNAVLAVEWRHSCRMQSCPARRASCASGAGSCSRPVSRAGRGGDAGGRWHHTRAGPHATAGCRCAHRHAWWRGGAVSARHPDPPARSAWAGVGGRPGRRCGFQVSDASQWHRHAKRAMVRFHRFAVYCRALMGCTVQLMWPNDAYHGRIKSCVPRRHAASQRVVLRGRRSQTPGQRSIALRYVCGGVLLTRTCLSAGWARADAGGEQGDSGVSRAASALPACKWRIATTQASPPPPLCGVCTRRQTTGTVWPRRRVACRGFATRGAGSPALQRRRWSTCVAALGATRSTLPWRRRRRARMRQQTARSCCATAMRAMRRLSVGPLQAVSLAAAVAVAVVGAAAVAMCYLRRHRRWRSGFSRHWHRGAARRRLTLTH
jgi:hypothetical protein